MRVFNILKSGFIAALLNICAYGAVIDNANIISEAVEIKLNSIGKELKSKTGVSLDLLTVENIKGINLKDIASSHIKTLQAPYVVLAIIPKDFSSKAGQLDIFASNDALALFDKEAVLSPFPQTGSIIPLLTQNKGKRTSKHQTQHIVSDVFLIFMQEFFGNFKKRYPAFNIQ